MRINQRGSRVVAFAIISLLSAAPFARAQAPVAGEGPRGERHHMGPGMRAGRGMRGLFRGITLSDAEKAKLKDVRAKYAPERKALHESMNPILRDARTARQKGDTAGVRAALERGKDGREKAKALMEREQADLRAALTPEHQKQFDVNLQRLAQRRAEWQKGGRRATRERRNG